MRRYTFTLTGGFDEDRRFVCEITSIEVNVPTMDDQLASGEKPTDLSTEHVFLAIASTLEDIDFSMFSC